MSTLEIYIHTLAWLSALTLTVLVLVLLYTLYREITQEIMKGIFPKALAPALIIAARLRVTEQPSAFTATVVTSEIEKAMARSADFAAAVRIWAAEQAPKSNKTEGGAS